MPTRFIPSHLLEHCDAWVARSVATVDATLDQRRMAAIWTLFRFSGVRLAELAWQQKSGLPRLELDVSGKGLLTVLGKGNKSRAIPLRTASPHWLRHAYARTLAVDKRVPLPAAQALLGHASVQTTSAYAKTDLTQLRAFVEAGFR